MASFNAANRTQNDSQTGLKISMNIDARKDAEQLINSIFPFAETMLKQYGEFYPYGGYLTLDGKIVDIGAQVYRKERPKSKDLLAILFESLENASRIHRCRAAAIVTNVTVVDPRSNKLSDAIEIHVDHIEGYSADVFYPYRLNGSEIVYGTAFAQPGSKPILVRN